MRQAFPRFVFLAALLPVFVLGCADRESPNVKETSNVKTLSGRLAAANEIRDVPEKDKALAKLASDAGDLGDAVFADKALPQMRDVPFKDKTAYSTALR